MAESDHGDGRPDPIRQSSRHAYANASRSGNSQDQSPPQRQSLRLFTGLAARSTHLYAHQCCLSVLDSGDTDAPRLSPVGRLPEMVLCGHAEWKYLIT